MRIRPYISAKTHKNIEKIFRWIVPVGIIYILSGFLGLKLPYEDEINTVLTAVIIGMGILYFTAEHELSWEERSKSNKAKK